MQQTTTRELAYRANDGVEVALFWSPSDDRLTVVVEDTKADERIELEARPTTPSMSSTTRTRTRRSGPVPPQPSPRSSAVT